MSKCESIKNNFIYSLLYNIINVITPFLITPYVARVLGVVNIGIYSYYFSISSYFVLFSMLGVSNYGNRSIASCRNDVNALSKCFWDIYYMQLGFSMISIIAYVIFVVFYSNNIYISSILLIHVLSASLDITWFFYGIENFRFVLFRNFLVKSISFLAVFYYVKTIDDLNIYMFIVALGFFIANAFMWSKLRLYVHWKPFNKKDSFQHIKPNLVLFIPVVAISVYNTMDKILLGSISGMNQVGLFDNADKIMTIPQMIVVSLGTIMLPRITNMISAGSKEAVKVCLERSLIFVALVSSISSFFIIMLANEFVRLYLGSEFIECINMIYILMPCLLFKAYANVFRMQYIIPMKQDKIYVYSVCLGAIINFVINIPLIYYFAAKGACVGTVITEIIVCLYQMRFVINKLNITRTLVEGFGFQLAGLIMLFVVFNIDFTGGLILVFLKKLSLGMMIYLALCIPYCKYMYSRYVKG